jgi:GAF domain-containing protein
VRTGPGSAERAGSRAARAPRRRWTRVGRSSTVGPHVSFATCPACATLIRTEEPVGTGTCPVCGAALTEGAPASVSALLALAAETLEVDLAMLTEVAEGQETAREVAGRWPGVEALPGVSVPLEETFCRKLLEGEIDNVVTDVAADPRVRDLGLARALGVGAWMGVPLRTSDARLLLLCLYSREARPDLDERSVRVLRAFAESVTLAIAR